MNKVHQEDYLKYPQRGQEINKLIDQFFHLDNITDSQLQKLEKLIADKFKRPQKLQEVQQQSSNPEYMRIKRIREMERQKQLKNNSQLPSIYQNSNNSHTNIKQSYLQPPQYGKKKRDFSTDSNTTGNLPLHNISHHTPSNDRNPLRGIDLSSSISERNNNNNQLNALNSKRQQINREKQQNQQQNININNNPSLFQQQSKEQSQQQSQQRQQYQMGQQPLQNLQESIIDGTPDYIVSDYGHDKVFWNDKKSICQLSVDYSRHPERSVDSILNVISIAKKKHKNGQKIKSIKVYY